MVAEKLPEIFSGKSCFKLQMKSQEHWNFTKVTKLIFCQLISTGTCLFVVLFYSPLSETLLQVSVERLFIYSLLYGVSVLISGEIIGLFANTHRNLAWKKLVISLVSAGIGTLGLILFVWVIEFEFVGRFAVLKMVLINGIFCFLFLNYLDRLNQKHPWRILVLLPEAEAVEIVNNFKSLNEQISWVSRTGQSADMDLIEFCRGNGVNMVIKNQADAGFDVMALLASGVRVLTVSALWETFTQKIPHSEITQDWLSKLNLRQLDPFVRRIKRLLDLCIAVVGLLLALPILLIACFAIGLETGFPLFFKQIRSGYLGKPYTLYKLRTMKKDAEESGAQWASSQDDRVTAVGWFLRKTRIDEIPQLWNVIKGEMSIVGPRPERPELESEIVQKLPFWKCRYLIKPGLTGWAQIKYQYASDMQSSEEKLAYDLFYVKNASFFLDLEIMLSTLRSLTKGSR